MSDKKQTRLRRAGKVRGRIRRLGAVRLTVHRTPRHFYAQIFAADTPGADGQRVLASASTLDREVRKQLAYGGNIAAATALGGVLAERAKAAGITRVAFDRAGFRYHGRVKAFAAAARAGGLQF